MRNYKELCNNIRDAVQAVFGGIISDFDDDKMSNMQSDEIQEFLALINDAVGYIEQMTGSGYDVEHDYRISIGRSFKKDLDEKNWFNRRTILYGRRDKCMEYVDHWVETGKNDVTGDDAILGHLRWLLSDYADEWKNVKKEDD